MNDSNKRKVVLAYLTANEGNYLVDYANFLLMTQHDPGVDHIDMLLVVSEVRKFRRRDKKALMMLNALVEKCEWLTLHKILVKGNVGRDFSSAQVALQRISGLADLSDIIMIRNRSAFGPFRENWCKCYVDLLMSQKTVGLVGNTINFSGHQHSKYENVDTTHVQTYVYVSRWEVLKLLKDDFPGMNEVNRISLIDNGEIGLSRKIMELGFSIRCLYWPDFCYDIRGVKNSSLPNHDVKNETTGLPFEHRRSLVKKYPTVYLKVRFWFQRLKFLFNGVNSIAHKIEFVPAIPNSPQKI